MLKKIISGGQTGADQAALDVAIKLGIPHGGWIPRGRKTETGVLDHKYNLKEMETFDYNKRTEQNVIDSDGTLIISHGRLSGGSDYTREMTLLHHRPWLHIDLNKRSAFQAAEKIKSWLTENEIEVLNVAGQVKILRYIRRRSILSKPFFILISSMTPCRHPLRVRPNAARN